MNQNLFFDIVTEMESLKKEGRFQDTHQFIQHGQISVYTHCRNVAYVSCRLAEKYHINVDQKSLIRGALLHDYFLYDWHEKRKGHCLHGFFHPGTALRNAQEDFELSNIEKNIIVRHMFPLTIIPPMCREAWLVCLADKLCALGETLSGITLLRRWRLLSGQF
ncbi:MAG: HD domain-containing protein [Thermoflexaceae bacterium]|nr:HD domain-containing protein [Thermoflexaceae bacterium]